jgi:uncharacterized cupredoxin-like copper-binding protein
VRRRAAALVVAVALAAPLAGCTTTPEPVPGGVPDGRPAAVQRVGLTEWDVVTEGRPLLPGPVELHVTNTGSAPHDLVLDVDGEIVATPVLASGQRHVLRFDAPAGQRLVSWCTVAGHRAQGMETDFTVAGE